jgi:hypothetical protein
MTHGDGGKGSGRRKEDASKVRDNWDLIFKPKKEQPMMNDDPQDLSEDYERSEDGYEICHHCSGSGEGMYDGSRCGFCHGTGEAPVERDYDDFDIPMEDDYNDYN